MTNFSLIDYLFGLYNNINDGQKKLKLISQKMDLK